MNIKNLIIDNELIKTLNASFNYSAEVNSARVSGQELSASKKKASTCSITFMALNKSTPFFNTAFKVATGAASGNRAFNINVTLDNNMTATMKMIINNYNLNSERAKLPSVNISMILYNELGDN